MDFKSNKNLISFQPVLKSRVNFGMSSKTEQKVNMTIVLFKPVVFPGNQERPGDQRVVSVGRPDHTLGRPHCVF